MPKVDIYTIEPYYGSDYPPPYDREAGNRAVRKLSAAAGITDMVVNHVVLPEGAWSSQRHWHEGEDEFLVMIAGAATLVDDAGETALGPGDCAAFPKDDGNGHHLIGGPGGAVFVAFGRPERSLCHYPDIDLLWDAANERQLHKDGTPY